ncbi:MAG: hypothetical protein OXG56_04605 [Gammaproteobacteria bacterium]|nr:hypothetical protein [Gammaproteobacteria bacterium]
MRTLDLRDSSVFEAVIGPVASSIAPAWDRRGKPWFQQQGTTTDWYR